MTGEGESVLVVPRCHCAGCRRCLEWDGDITADAMIYLRCNNKACRQYHKPLGVRIFAARATPALTTQEQKG